ncbi:protein kinase [Colletotrichum musicola]|uniref:Protein kinase n=1 Tax=Colletotrichum musicola TaxID=2175873 RepID=A0A8H6J569_9PEZI|nr:protein kinase [Colletotrichum musicola]
MSGVELALGIGGLVVSAIQVYSRVSIVFAKDNGLLYLATKYYIEKVKLEAWAERVNISEPDSCLLLNHSEMVQKAVLRIIAEINATNDHAEKLVQKYRIVDPVDPLAPNTQKKTFSRSSTWVKSARDERYSMKQTSKASWAIKDKDELSSVVQKLGQLNRDLQDLVRLEEIDVVRIVTGVISGLESKSLDALRKGQDDQDQSGLLSLSAKLKEVMAEDDTARSRKVKLLNGRFHRSATIAGDGMNDREIGCYDEDNAEPINVWVEWKSIVKDHPKKDELVVRIEALNVLLTTSNSPHYLQPTCLGLLHDTAYEEKTQGTKRLGFIHELHTKDPQQEIITLQYMLSAAQPTHYMPPLDERFELARKLASALSLLHAADWIHKSLRSDNVVFISTPGKGAKEPPHNIANPQIAGFQYTRQAGSDSIETRALGNARVEMYYHPDVVNGWTKANEIYSLGIILLEIATWRTVFDKKFTTMDPKSISDTIQKRLNRSWGEQIKGLVGKVYFNVVKECLTGFRGEYEGTPASAELLSKLFFRRVVKPLYSCRS